MSKPKLLNDAQMREFIANGFISLKADFPKEFHQTIYDKTKQVFDNGGNPGNNVLPSVPELNQIFDHPTIHGALQSVLGEGYYMHPHRHCHVNPPGSPGQGLHKDSWNRRRHRTRWGMAFYYPQDTPVELGPTGIVPGSHVDNQRPPRDEHALTGEAGTVVIVHYDLWHRGMPNKGEMVRYMQKFLFTRLSEPTRPDWDCDSRDFAEENENGRSRMYRSLWNWHCSNNPTLKPASDEQIADWIGQLSDEDETAAFNAAYALGEAGEPAIQPLIDAMKSDSEYEARNATYGLAAMGKPAVQPLIRELSDPRPQTRRFAVETLGDIGPAAAEAVPEMAELTTDEDGSIRRAAAEALGIAGQKTLDAAKPIASLLADSDEWTRRNASHALMRLGPNARPAEDALRDALNDGNRYVRANSMQALARIGTPKANAAALDFLMASRWCPITNRHSTF